jgi:hypothetical protein
MVRYCETLISFPESASEDDLAMPRKQNSAGELIVSRQVGEESSQLRSRF